MRLRYWRSGPIDVPLKGRVITKLTISDDLRSKLAALAAPVALCDESGRTLGYFHPVPDRSLYEGVEPPISEEELDRREQEGGGRPLAEILADRKKRA